jgi:hypothetical protein
MDQDGTLTSLGANSRPAAASPLGCHSSGSDGDKTSTSSLSWVVQLQLYLRASCQGLPGASAAQRKQLADVVLENPNGAEAWFNFLQYEENLAAQQQLLPSCIVGGKRLSLLHWYHKATEFVQRSRGQAAEAYVGIWLGYARHQW